MFNKKNQSKKHEEEGFETRTQNPSKSPPQNPLSSSQERRDNPSERRPQKTKQY